MNEDEVLSLVEKIQRDLNEIIVFLEHSIKESELERK